jgi:hypothetical protein
MQAALRRRKEIKSDGVRKDRKEVEQVKEKEASISSTRSLRRHMTQFSQTKPKEP